MSQPLPTHGFYWLNAEEIQNIAISEIPEDGEDGYIFKVNLKYPQHLHDTHNDYPLAPEKKSIREEMLSPYSKDTWKAIHPEHTYTSTEKLITDLHDKENYVVHYRNLQLYTAMGMEVTKIHCVLGFKQSAWLRPYITFNTEKRKQAKNA